jgi:predicted HAD superfamily Cof-like phosphohydrolase
VAAAGAQQPEQLVVHVVVDDHRVVRQAAGRVVERLGHRDRVGRVHQLGGLVPEL